MAVATTIAVVGLVAGAVGSNERIKREERAEDIRKDKQSFQKKVRSEQAAKSRRIEVRKAARARASIENVAAQTGAAGSSSEIGNINQVFADSAANIASINTKIGTADHITDLNEDLFKTQQPTGLELGAGVIQSGLSLFSSVNKPKGE